jgi:hemerythrin HHE cation binding domain-containing protein
MRRHPALVPLSHHHHQALVMGRRARRAATAAPGEQTLAARAYLEFFDGHAIGHFRDEEERVFPLLLEDRADAPPELSRALVEHARLRALARQLRAALARGELDSSML